MRSPQSPQQWNNQLATLQAELADGDRPAALQVGTHVALGQLYYNAANYTQALTHYEDALNLAPHSIEALNGQGNALRHLGRQAEAIVAYDLAINRSPQRAELWTNRGRSCERLGRLREAIADYEHALKLDATRYRLWQRHADLRYRQQRFGAALISYAQALAVQPLKEEEITSQCLFIASPGPYVQRYQAAFSQLDLRLEKAVKQDPVWGSLWKVQGERLAKFGFWLEAIASYNQALSKHPRNPELHLLRAQSLEALTRWDEAELEYQQSLDLFVAQGDLPGEVRCREAMGSAQIRRTAQCTQHNLATSQDQQSDSPTQDWLRQIGQQAKNILARLR